MATTGKKVREVTCRISIQQRRQKTIHSMKTETQKKQPGQHGHINLSEPGEIRYWAQQLGVTDQQIIEAVKYVGSSSDEVKKHLKKL